MRLSSFILVSFLFLPNVFAYQKYTFFDTSKVIKNPYGRKYQMTCGSSDYKTDMNREIRLQNSNVWASTTVSAKYQKACQTTTQLVERQDLEVFTAKDAELEEKINRVKTVVVATVQQLESTITADPKFREDLRSLVYDVVKQVLAEEKVK